MANDVNIRVTGDDDSKPAFASATVSAQKFKSEARDAGGAAKLLGSELSAAAREAEKEARANLAAATAARQLDREIEEAADSLRKLRIEQALTDRGSGDFTEKIKAQERALGELKRARQQIGSVDFSQLVDLGDAEKQGHKAGSVLAQGTLTGFGSTARSLGPVAGSFGIAIAMQVATVAGPLITASIGGAIAAGAAAGVAGLGVALVAQDAKVKAAAGKLANGLKEGLRFEAHVLIGPVLDALEELEGASARLMPRFGRMFSNVAPYVGQLTRGITGLAENALGGLERLTAKAAPVIAEISAELPGLGASIGKLFDSIGDAAPAAAIGIGDLIDVIGAFIRFAGFAIETGSRMWAIFKGVTTLDWSSLKAGFTDQRAIMKDLKPDQESWLELLTESTAATVDYAQSIRDMASAQLASQNAAIGMEEAIDNATEAAKKNKKGIDINTEAGRENRRMLLNLAGATQNYVEDLRNTGASAETMTAAMNRGRTAFIRVAREMGVSKAEAERLANALFRLDGINVTPTVDVKVIGASRLSKVENQINRLGGGIFAHGGIKGAADGRMGSGLTWVGEQGPELVQLPAGARVHSNPDSQRMVEESRSHAGGGSTVVQVMPGATRDEVIEMLMKLLRIGVKRVGGNVQQAIGWGGAAA